VDDFEQRVCDLEEVEDRLQVGNFAASTPVVATGCVCWLKADDDCLVGAGDAAEHPQYRKFRWLCCVVAAGPQALEKLHGCRCRTHHQGYRVCHCRSQNLVADVSREGRPCRWCPRANEIVSKGQRRWAARACSDLRIRQLLLMPPQSLAHCSLRYEQVVRDWRTTRQQLPGV